MPLRRVRKKISAPPVREHSTFLWMWAASPLKVGAIAPSGRKLANAMARQVDPHGNGWVVELGAGTGVMTRALLEQGVKPERLLILEREWKFYTLLHRTFPQLRVVHSDAVHLGDVLAKEDIHKVSAIVSSLPLLSIPKHIERKIVDQMIQAIGDYGYIIQFTYGIASPIARKYLKNKKIFAKKMNHVWLNLPPATVWRYEKGRK